MNRLLATLRPNGLPTRQAAGSSLSTSAPAHAAAVSVPGLGGRANTVFDAPDTSPSEPPGACGWFDSSHALQHGLCVTEHASADAVAGDLPLADWLQLHLCGWPALPSAPTQGLNGRSRH